MLFDLIFLLGLVRKIVPLFILALDVFASRLADGMFNARVIHFQMSPNFD